MSIVSRLLVTLALTAPLFAADAFYLGTWKITAATVAPWAEPGNKAGHRPYEPERKLLVGQTVVFKTGSIEGPRQVACKGPKYVVKDYPADMLFQGAFGEMQRAEKSVDPVKMAEKVGFRGKSWKTVETGCEMELDWHFIDKDTAAFALNNLVYTLKKQ